MNLFTISNNSWNNQSITEKLTDISLEHKRLLASNRGYVIAPQKVLRCFRLSDLEIRVLLDLMSLMGEKDYAFPGHKYLTFHLGKKSVTSIKNALSALKEKEFIVWKNGGNFGTNHYWVKNLHYNPYIIMSEATHYCVKKILEIYVNKISYEDLYGAVLDFIQPKNNVEGSDKDLYSHYLQHLADNPEDRDCPNLYITYCDRLSDHIENKTGFSIDILWDVHFSEVFEDRIPYKYIEDNELSMYHISHKIMSRYNIIEEKFGYSWINEEVSDVNVEDNNSPHAEFNKFTIEANNYIESLGTSVNANQKFFIKNKYLTNKILDHLPEN